MKYRVHHHTTYHYSDRIATSHNQLWLRARNTDRQTCLSHQLFIDPEPDVSCDRRDFFGNPVRFFAVRRPHQLVQITAINEVEIRPLEPANPADTPAWEQVRDRLRADRSPAVLDACQFIFESPLIPTLPEARGYAETTFRAHRPILDAAVELMHRVHLDFAYDPGATTVHTPLAQIAAQRRGVCQDFAHFQIACLRALGLAARYVSGYIPTTPAPEAGPLVGAAASHAWLAVFVPGSGWIDLDPTNDLLPDEHHITVAWGRDYADVSPIRGAIYGGGQQRVAVGVEVTPL